MAEDYTADILDAEADIREAGELVTVIFKGGSVPDPDKPWKEIALSPAEYEDVPICYVPEGSAEWRMYTAGTDIPKGATVALLPGNVSFPVHLKLLIQSASRGLLRITRIDKLAPGAQTILYTLRLEE